MLNFPVEVRKDALVIYLLLNVEGKKRNEELGVIPMCYSNKEYAAQWYNHLLAILNDSNLPQTNKAKDALAELYGIMTADF